MVNEIVRYKHINALHIGSILQVYYLEYLQYLEIPMLSLKNF